jgi:hypothetical protein
MLTPPEGKNGNPVRFCRNTIHNLREKSRILSGIAKSPGGTGGVLKQEMSEAEKPVDNRFCFLR